jgi:hypothetical protein
MGVTSRYRAEPSNSRYIFSCGCALTDGLAKGYLDLDPGGSARTITTTAGMRFRF